MEITGINEKNISGFGGLLGGDIPQGAGALGAIEDGAPVGAALFSSDNNSCYLDHIFVHPKYRRRGIATALLSEAKKIMSDSGIFDMMCYFGEDEALKALLKKEGFAMVPSSPVYSIKISDIASSERVQKYLSDDSPDVTPIDSLSGGGKRVVQSLLAENEMDTAMAKEGAYDGDISFAYMEDEKPTGLVLASHEDGDILVNAAVSNGKGEKAIISLMATFFKAAGRKAGMGSRMIFVGRNPSIVGFIQSMAGKDKLNREGTYEAHLIF
ncbi:MAG: GNAT family N-acetyltransferase [Lachnospiraceae bacterium]|nr:GNAT family N-acetyltransferase [Lachnospiraceae bacterium]